MRRSRATPRCGQLRGCCAAIGVGTRCAALGAACLGGSAADGECPCGPSRMHTRGRVLSAATGRRQPLRSAVGAAPACPAPLGPAQPPPRPICSEDRRGFGSPAGRVVLASSRGWSLGQALLAGI